MNFRDRKKELCSKQDKKEVAQPKLETNRKPMVLSNSMDLEF
jgi:hypothetical protein